MSSSLGQHLTVPEVWELCGSSRQSLQNDISSSITGVLPFHVSQVFLPAISQYVCEAQDGEGVKNRACHSFDKMW